MSHQQRQPLREHDVLSVKSNETDAHKRYTITASLSQHGGTALVYRAQEGGRQVVIKELFPYDRSTQRDARTGALTQKGELFAMYRSHFEREIQILKQLRYKQRYAPVKLLDSFYANDTLYYTMPYEEGISLQLSPLSDAQIMLMLHNILQLLVAMESQGIIHADIKPANILHVAPERFVLIDFGAARYVYKNQNNKGIEFPRTYSKGFAAPEQLENRFDQICFATDIYCLASTVYYPKFSPNTNYVAFRAAAQKPL